MQNELPGAQASALTLTSTSLYSTSPLLSHNLLKRMKSKRAQQAVADLTARPPANLEPGQAIARIVAAEGKNLWTVELPTESSDNAPDPISTKLLVELPARFRSFIWLKRGGFVVVDTNTFEERENKLRGEICNVVRDEKSWRKQVYWPKQFTKRKIGNDESDGDGEDFVTGEMPHSDDSEECKQ